MATRRPQGQSPRAGQAGGGGGGGARGGGGGGAAGPGPAVRSLRVGVALGDHFIDERLFRSRENITLGQSAKNTFSIPIENLPKAWPLFTVENGRYVLHFTEAMDGRLSDGQNVYTFDALRGRGAERRGDHWAVPLVETSRGKVELGTMKLLFQFVSAPPLQPRPRLPASVRGSLADRIDPRLAVILLLSILIHASVMIYAYNMDRVITSRNDQIFHQFQQDTFKDKVIVEPVEVKTTGQDTAATQPEKQGGDDNKSHKISTPKDTGGDDQGAPDDATINEKIQQSALVSAITGSEGSGGRYSKMNETDQGAGLDKSIQNAHGKNIASIGEGGGRHTRGPNTGKIGSGHGGEVTGPGHGQQVGHKVEEKVSRAKFDVEDLTESTLDPDAVAKIIRARYLQGIKRCHQIALKRDPTSHGRVTLRFTVTPTGGVSKSSVKGFDPSVDTCIHALTLHWRFGAPRDDDGKPTTAEFQIPLILQPG